MKTVLINLYSFDELNEQAQRKAIFEHESFLVQLGYDYEDDEGNLVKEYPSYYDDEYVIESIVGNEYLFLSDGSLAHCVTYCGNHPKAGLTELKIGSDIYTI